MCSDSESGSPVLLSTPVQALGASGTLGASSLARGELPRSHTLWKPRCPGTQGGHPDCDSGKSPLKLPALPQ